LAKVSNDFGVTSGSILNTNDSLDKYVLSRFVEEYNSEAGSSGIFTDHYKGMDEEEIFTKVKADMSNEQRTAYEEYKLKYIAGQSFLNNNITEYNTMAGTGKKIVEGYKGQNFKGSSYYKPSTNFIPMAKAEEDKYAAQMLNFFDVVSGKTSSGSSIMRKSISGALTIQNRVGRGMSIQGVKDLRGKILGADVYIDLDTENLGGKNLEGKRLLSNMTEYSFNVYDINRPKGVREDAVASFRKSISGFVGIKPGGSASEVGTEAYYEAMIKKLEMRNGPRMTDEEFITVNGLFKYGHGDGHIAWDAAEGKWDIGTAKEDFKDVWNVDSVRKGLQRAVDAYGINQANVDSRGLTKVDRDMLDVYKLLQKDKTYLGGQNIVHADIPWLNQYMTNASDVFKNVFKQEFGDAPVGFDLSHDKIIDRFPLMQTVMASENTNRILGPHAAAVPRDLSGKTPLAGEVLGKMFGANGTGSYHNAYNDSIINAQLMIGATPKESFRVADSVMIKMADEVIGNRNNSTQASYLKDVTWENVNSRFLFRANEGMHGNDAFAPHELSFAMNGLVNGYTTFGGKSVGRDGAGNAFAQDYGQSSVRRHSLLSITGSGKIEFGQGAQADAVRDAIKKLHPNFDQDFLYYAEFTNVFDKTVDGAEGNERLNSKQYVVARSESELASRISQFDAIGKRIDPNSDMNLASSWSIINPEDEKAFLEQNRKFMIEDGGAGNAVVKELGAAGSYQEFLSDEMRSGTKHTLRESAARSVRDEKYNKLRQAQTFLRNVDESIGAKFSDPGFKSTIAADLTASGASTPEELIAHYRRVGYNQSILDKAINDVKAVARAVSTDSSIDMEALRKHSLKAANAVISKSLGNVTPAFLAQRAAVGSYNRLNYQFGKDFHLAQSSQIDTMGLNANFYAKTASVNDTILGIIDSVDKEQNKGWGTTDKSDLYSMIYGSVKSDLAQGLDTAGKRSLIDGASPVEISAADMNYFEFNLGNEFVKDGREKFANETSEVIKDTSRVFKISNLDTGFSIGSQLAARHNRSAAEDTSTLARGELFKFITMLKKGYKGGDADTNKAVTAAFADFELDKDNKLVSYMVGGGKDRKKQYVAEVNTNLLGNEVANRLQGIVRKDPKLGKVMPMYGTNSLESTLLTEKMAGLGADEIAAIAAKAREMASSHSSTVTWNGDSKRMQGVVNDYIHKMYSGLEGIYGHGDDKHAALMNRFGLTSEKAKFEQMKFGKAKDELGEYYHRLLSNANKAGLDVDFRDNGIFIGNGNSRIALDRMPALYKDDIAGTLGIRYGNSEGALQMYMNVDANGNATSRTSFGEAFSTLDFKMENAFEKSKDKKNELNTALSVISNFNTRLMENPAINKANLMSIGQGFVYDYSDITKLLNPDSSIIDYSKITLGNNGEAEQKALGSMKERLRQAAKTKEGIKGFDKIFGGDKEVIGSILSQVREQLINSKSLDADTKKLLMWSNFAYKDVHAAEGKATIGAFGNDTYADYANMQRPNPWQQNSLAFDEELAVERTARNMGVSKESARAILGTNGPMVTSRSYLSQRGGKIGGRMYGTTLTMTALQTSSEQYRGMVQSHYAKKGNNLTGRERIIKDHILNTSLYAQQGVADSRIISGAVDYSSPQFIPASKEAIAALDTMAKTKEVQENTMGKLLPTFEIVNGKLQVKLQRQGKYVKRFDNVMNTLGYGGSEQQWLSKSPYAMASLKFFTHHGVEVGEDQINEAIKGIGGTTSKDMMAAVEVLKNTFDLKIHVDNLEESSYRKLSLGSAEKAMFDVVTVGLGRLSEGNKYLEALHTDTAKSLEIAKGSGIKIGDLLGKGLRDRYLEQIADAMAASGLVSGASSKDFFGAMREEKHAASKYLFGDIAKMAQDEVMQKSGGTISAFYSAELKKHKVANLVMESSMNLMTAVYKKQGHTTEQIYDKVKGIFTVDGKEGLEYDKNLDRILLRSSSGNNPLGSKIDKTALETAMTNAGLTYEADGIMDEEGKSMGTRYGLGAHYEGYNGEKILAGNAHMLGTVIIDDEAKVTADGLAASKWASDADKNLLGQYGKNYTSAHRLIERGVAVGDREALMMNQVKEDTAYSFLEGKLDSGLWNELTGHLDGKPGNKGLMSYYTKNAMKKQYITDEDRVFGNSMADRLGDKIKDGKIADSNYSHLQGIYDEFGGGKDISLQKAEQLYGLKENMKALTFNEGKYGVDDMKKMGFVGKDIRDVHVGQNGAASVAEQMDNNIYKNNLLIDMYGDDLAGSVSDSDRYLAVGRMPMRPYGDTVVNYDYQSELDRLRGSRNTIADLKERHGENSTEVANAVSAYGEKIAKFKKGMNKDVLGKEGVFSHLSRVRMSMSSNAKAAGFIHLTAEDLKTGVGKSYKALANDLATTREVLTTKEKDKMYVADIMKTAKVNGKSLIDHYEKGNYYDVKFMSAEAFESMGLLDSKYSDKLNLKGKDELLKYYSENGVMGVTGRYPTIYNESFKPTMLYYNDKLAGHKMTMNAEGVGTAHGDFDGDTTATFVATYGKGKWTSAQMERLTKATDGERSKLLGQMDMTGDEYTEAKNAYSSIRMLQEYNARGINQYQHGKEVKDASGMIVDSVTDHREIFEGRGTDHANSWMPGSIEQENLYRAKYGELHSRISADGKQRGYKDVISAMNSHIDSAAYSGEEKEMYRNAVSFQIIDKMTKNAELTGFKKSSIGVANIPLFADRQLAELAIGNSKGTKERDVMLHTVQHMSEAIEQSIISSKNAQSDGLMEVLGKTQRFSEAHSEALMEGNFKPLETFLKNDVDQKDIQKYLTDRMPHYVKDFDKDTFDPVSKYIETLELVRNRVGKTGIKNFTITTKLGASINGTKNNAKGMDFMVSAYGQETMASNLAHHIGNVDSEFAGTMNALSGDTADTILSRGKTQLIDGREYLSDTSARGEISSIIEGTQKMFAKAAEGVTGKSLALGAMGIAGSFMVAAFAGGHTEPVQTQAMDMANEGYSVSDFYATSPTLADNPVQGRQQQGYAINIKGQTSKNDRHAQQAVKDAVYQSTSTNVNLSMNINSSKSNISDRDIENMVMGAMN
jgi:hypothetical protein